MKEIEKEIEDLYFEHSQHLIYEPKCSECYNNAPKVKMEDGFIVLDRSQDELTPPLTEADLAQLEYDKRVEEAEQSIQHNEEE
jgi:hypothetical protein